MKTFTNSYFLILLTLLNFNFLFSKPMIIAYLQPMPKSAQITDGNLNNSNQKTIYEKINKISQKSPAGFSKNALKNSLKLQQIPSVGGFLVTYGGYMELSGTDGLITFPLKHTPPTRVNLVISSSVELIPIRAETFAFEELPSKDPALSKMYSFNKNKDKKGFFYWNVVEEQLPSNNQISPIAIIIHTNPENIFVQNGEFPSEESAHVILPQNIYVLGNNMNIKILIKFLDKASYYEPIKFNVDSPKDTLLETIIENN